ncbi:hypothetical protein D9M72_615150 [compost metagenome]
MAIGRGSAISSGSMPARGGTSIASPSAMAISASPIACASLGTEAALRPRSCRFPRAVISMMPLPKRSAAVARAMTFGSVRLSSVGLTLTSRPSPVCIGSAKDGQAPRRIEATVPASPVNGRAQLVIKSVIT